MNDQRNIIVIEAAQKQGMIVAIANGAKRRLQGKPYEKK